MSDNKCECGYPLSRHEIRDGICSGFTPADDPAPDEREGDAETLAIFLHTTYEHLAPQFGYETRKETREFDPRSPNGMLMIATAKAILDQFFSSRLAEAEAVIDHYADERRWLKAVMSDGNETIGKVRYFGMPDNGYDKAREYRAKYPKGENL